MSACLVAADRLGSTSHTHGNVFQQVEYVLRIAASSGKMYGDMAAAMVIAWRDGRAFVELPASSN